MFALSIILWLLWKFNIRLSFSLKNSLRVCSHNEVLTLPFARDSLASLENKKWHQQWDSSTKTLLEMFEYQFDSMSFYQHIVKKIDMQLQYCQLVTVVTIFAVHKFSTYAVQWKWSTWSNNGCMNFDDIIFSLIKYYWFDEITSLFEQKITLTTTCKSNPINSNNAFIVYDCCTCTLPRLCINYLMCELHFDNVWHLIIVEDD